MFSLKVMNIQIRYFLIFDHKVRVKCLSVVLVPRLVQMDSEQLRYWWFCRYSPYSFFDFTVVVFIMFSINLMNMKIR